MPLGLEFLWKPVGGVGLEHCRVWKSSDGINVSDRRGRRFWLRRPVRYPASADWTFRSLTLRLQDGRVLRLDSNGLGAWKVGGQRARPEFEGCVDIDSSGTPFTNTPPIRRSRFVDGVPQQLAMAWVPLDSP